MPASRHQPNVLIIMMDDLAFGDLACHGNPYIQTPNLDRLHAQSARLTRYTSGPLCTPARAALMTGRHPYRTRAIDTYCGRSMLDAEEITLAQTLRDAGYQTCISGKWHLGDCYPTRAIDRGFDEAFVHNSGGIGQPGNLQRNGYFDPGLMHNGKLTPSKGYCTDIFTDHCIDYIAKHRDQPWFCYLATNAPHVPLIVADKWAKPYRDMGLPDVYAKLYGMVSNIDMNVGRVLDHLDKLKLADDTIVVFTSDHGPCPSSRHNGEHRFNAGLRGQKGSLYEGGIRTPCLWRWPNRFPEGRDIDRLANPIDFLPTLAAACGASLPADRTIDGINLLPLLTGEADVGRWPDRTLCMQWHRGDIPQRYRNAAVLTQRYKWVCDIGWEADERIGKPELFDLQDDPHEQHDIIADCPDLAADLKAEYDRWFDDVSSTRGSTPEENYAPPPIVLGDAHANPVLLSRQDGRLYPGVAEGWGDKHPMFWHVRIDKPAVFDVRVQLPESLAFPGRLTIRWQDVERTIDPNHDGDPVAGSVVLPSLHLPAGVGSFEARLEREGEAMCVQDVTLTRTGLPVNIF